MRHANIRLTMEVYTDPQLFDLQGAVEAIPSVASSVAQTPVKCGATESLSVNSASHADVA
jgi:hypothetical protein